jgi:hypothetical protein
VTGRIAALGFLLVASTACGEDVEYHGTDTARNAANFQRAFDERPPADVDVVNSIFRQYRWRLGQVSTPDWDFEVVAPRAWLTRRTEELNLSPGDSPICATSILERQVKTQRYLPWYAPKPIESYESYCLTRTSIPYVHLLIDEELENDGRFRAFLSKH